MICTLLGMYVWTIGVRVCAFNVGMERVERLREWGENEKKRERERERRKRKQKGREKGGERGERKKQNRAKIGNRHAR